MTIPRDLPYKYGRKISNRLVPIIEYSDRLSERPFSFHQAYLIINGRRHSFEPALRCDVLQPWYSKSKVCDWRWFRLTLQPCRTKDGGDVDYQP